MWQDLNKEQSFCNARSAPTAPTACGLAPGPEGPLSWLDVTACHSVHTRPQRLPGSSSPELLLPTLPSTDGACSLAGSDKAGQASEGEVGGECTDRSGPGLSARRGARTPRQTHRETCCWGPESWLQVPSRHVLPRTGNRPRHFPHLPWGRWVGTGPGHGGGNQGAGTGHGLLMACVTHDERSADTEGTGPSRSLPRAPLPNPQNGQQQLPSRAPRSASRGLDAALAESVLTPATGMDSPTARTAFG